MGQTIERNLTRIARFPSGIDAQNDRREPSNFNIRCLDMQASQVQT